MFRWRAAPRLPGVPTEIFISYRRSDAIGNARYLNRELRQCFDPAQVFFDLSSLEAGDEFPEEITNALRECKVLLALIGPGWAGADQGGRRRLDNPADFVRREILLALELGKRVIPVLLDDAPMPQAADVPAVLAPLLAQDAHVQRGKSFEYDAQLQHLVRLLARVPGVTPPLVPARRAVAGTAGAVDGDKLALLCDRSPQDDATADTLRAELKSERRRPIVLVLHGRADEEHHAFVERLEDFSLPRLLKGTPFAKGVKFARLNDALPVDAGQAAFDRRLRDKLGEALDIGMVDDDAALLRQMQQLKVSSMVAVVTWRASELSGDALVTLQRVFGYWAQFPPLGAQTLAGCIVCLKYDRPASGSGGWLKRAFGRGPVDRSAALRDAVAKSEAAYAQDPRVAWCVAGELPSVNVNDVDRWAAEVNRLIGRFSVTEEGLHAIIGSEGTRPMQAVLPELRKLVPAG